jgi:hypothetical protein
MGGYRLREGASFCCIDDRHVFLDLLSDKYFGLGVAADRQFARILAGENVDPGDVAPMLRSGLLSKAPQEEVPIPCSQWTQVPATEGVATQRASITMVASALWRRTCWSRHVRQRSLGDNIALLTRKRSSIVAGIADPDALGRIEGGYRRAALIWSERDRCLATAMALMDELLAHGIAVQLVFGVRTDPFQAHCWVEANGLAVGQDTAALSAFSQIAVV